MSFWHPFSKGKTKGVNDKHMKHAAMKLTCQLKEDTVIIKMNEMFYF